MLSFLEEYEEGKAEVQDKEGEERCFAYAPTQDDLAP